jgi:hypothetical protein
VVGCSQQPQNAPGPAATIDGLPYAALPDPAHAVGALTDPDVFHPGRTGRNALRVLAARPASPTAESTSCSNWST